MKIKNLVLLAAVLVVAVSCDSNTKKTANGTSYTYIKKGTGALATDSLISLFNLKYATESGQIIFQSNPENPQPMKLDTSLPGMNNEVIQVFSALKVGDSVTFDISAKEFFEKLLQGIPRPDSIAEESKIKFEVGYVNQITEKEFQEMMMKKQQEAIAKQQEEMAKQLKIDNDVLDKYLTDNNIDAQKTDSGLRYVITKKGTGESPKAGQKVKVFYAGKLLSGQFFDSNIEALAKENDIYQEGRDYKNPFEFQLGTGGVIRGWDEGIALMKKGEKTTFYIPSTLAYGPNQRGPVIKPNSILVFDVELIDFE